MWSLGNIENWSFRNVALHLWRQASTAFTLLRLEQKLEWLGQLSPQIWSEARPLVQKSLTCVPDMQRSRTQRGPLALHFIRVWILAWCRKSGWFFKPKLNLLYPQMSWRCSPAVCWNDVRMKQSSQNKTNTLTLWFHLSQWLMAAFFTVTF